MEKIAVLTTTSDFSAPIDDDRIKIIKNPYGRRLLEDEVYSLVKNLRPVGIIAGIEPLTEKVMKASDTLRVISRCGIGLDSVDLDAASNLGISVLNTPDEPTDAVAELTVALTLSVLRYVPVLDKGVREGVWKGPRGHLLKGKTVGIIGCGRIGSRVALFFKGFGCRVIGYDPFVKTHEAIEMTDMDDLMNRSDIVTLHVPLNENTRNIISKERINSMKQGSVLINASRGGLVDEHALYDALASKRLCGAALDCFSHEPYTGNLTELDNIVVTPHTGSSTFQTRKAMEEKAVANLLAELSELGIL